MSPVHVYVGVLTAFALPVGAWAVWSDLPDGTSAPGSWVGLLMAAMLLGQALPFVVGRGVCKNEISFSSAFAYALVLVTPLGWAILAWLTVSIISDLRLRKNFIRVIFNCSQYCLTASAAAGTYYVVADERVLSTAHVDGRQMLGMLAAYVVFIVVNQLAVSVVIALHIGQSLWRTLVEDQATAIIPESIALSMAPAVIAVLHFSPWLIPMLMGVSTVMQTGAKQSALREHESLHDSLTGLPNRGFLYAHFRDAQQARPNDTFAVMLIDLDHFKDINDTLGHHVGDHLLCEVATRLSSVLREGDVVARLGGDEFGVLSHLDTEDHRGEAQGLAERLLLVLEDPFLAAGVRIDVQGSVGIALAPEHGTSIETLMSRADIALYVSKEERGSATIYSPEGDERSPERLSLLGELREGIERGELVLHYQPKVDVASGSVVGVEALVRWQHPRKGLMAPFDFIPLAENTGLIVPLTMSVLEQALTQTRRWNDSGYAITMSVNLSVRHLTDNALPDQIAEALRRHGVPAEQLILEVTESTIMNDPTRAGLILSRLRGLGVRIAVDDFGTGYSSLAYLRRLHIDELKIDRSFITNLAVDAGDEVIVRSTIEMGHNLGLRIVAEGVEDTATWDRLAGLHCDLIQGFLISRPVPAAEIDAWLVGKHVTNIQPSRSAPAAAISASG